jgi:putative RNA 2'-phosphotransferase
VSAVDRDELVEVSRFLSYVLRHRPEAIGIRLDREGWVGIDGLIAGAAAAGRRLDIALIRFAISADQRRIRALQGHSTPEVEIAHEARIPPEVLYHGTVRRFLDAISARGLSAGARRHVHLSPDPRAAEAVGRRHGRPVVLEVAAGPMHRAGFTFYRAQNGVWLTDHVPPAFVTIPKGPNPR